MKSVFVKLHRHISFCQRWLLNGWCWGKFFGIKTYWTPAKMLLLANVDECTFTNTVKLSTSDKYIMYLTISFYQSLNRNLSFGHSPKLQNWTRSFVVPIEVHVTTKSILSQCCFISYDMRKYEDVCQGRILNIMHKKLGSPKYFVVWLLIRAHWHTMSHNCTIKTMTSML